MQHGFFQRRVSTLGFCAVSFLILTGCSQSSKEAISECAGLANETLPGPQSGEFYLEKLRVIRSCMLDKGFQINQDGYDRYLRTNSQYVKNDSDREKLRHTAYLIDYVWE